MQSVQQSVKNSCQIEILIPRNTITNQLVFPFPDQPFLRGKKITNVVMSLQNFSANSGLFNLNFIIATNQSLTGFIGTNSVFLTLQDIHGNQVVQNMPILELNPYNINAFNQTPVASDGVSKYNVDGIQAFSPSEIVWTKSYLSVPTAAFSTSSASDRGFQFTVFFNN